MSKLTIVAHITAKADKIEQVKAELEKLIAPTCEEEGCLQYDLHQDRDCLPSSSVGQIKRVA